MSVAMCAVCLFGLYKNDLKMPFKRGRILYELETREFEIVRHKNINKLALYVQI
jgi:hypothetical protein